MSEQLVLESTNNHPNVVSCYGVAVDDPEGKSIVFEYAKFGDLYTYLRKHEENKTKPDFNFVLKVAKNIAQGMKFLHDLDILHRDLKSMNILVLF